MYIRVVRPTISPKTKFKQSLIMGNIFTPARAGVKSRSIMIIYYNNNNNNDTRVSDGKQYF